MNRTELFKKYSIDESHNVWDDKIDSWMSVEVYRIMNNKLPNPNDLKLKYVIDFLDKTKNDMSFVAKLMSENNFGSLYLTSKRMLYRFSDQILTELNSPTINTK